MKKIFLLVLFSFFLSTPVHAQSMPDIDDNEVPLVGSANCVKPKDQGGLGGRCSQDGYVTSGDGFDYCQNGEGTLDVENDTETFAGYCEPGGFDDVFTSSGRKDCCVPKGSVTAEDIEKNRITRWVDSDLCEKAASEGGVGGKCLNGDSGINPLDFSDSCSEYPETPRFAGYCGTFVGNYVCCISNERATEVTGGPPQPLATTYGNYQLLELIPGSGNTSGQLQPYLESLYRAGFVLIILGAIFMIGFGGFTYMASAGNTAMIKKGKGLITDALIGLIVAFFVWLILNIINPDLVRLQIDPLPGLNFDPSGVGVITATQNSQNANGAVMRLTLRGGGTAEVHACAAGDSERIRVPFLGHTANVHRNLAPSLRRIDAEWRRLGGNTFYRVTSVGGYNCRNATRSNRLSYHAYGLVVDINPATNPYRDDNRLVTDMPAAFVRLFTNEGWGWGGNWNSSKDAMHFSKTGNGEQGDMRGE